MIVRRRAPCRSFCRAARIALADAVGTGERIVLAGAFGTGERINLAGAFGTGMGSFTSARSHAKNGGPISFRGGLRQ